MNAHAPACTHPGPLHLLALGSAPQQVKRIEAAGGRIMGGHLVTDFEADPASGAITRVLAKDVTSGAAVSFEADAVVSAVGVTGVRRRLNLGSGQRH